MKSKKVFKMFTIAEYENEQEYLREMHKQGWKLNHVSGLGMYHFEECEGADVIYQLDYNPEGVTHKEEYVQMFEDCGWEYIQDFLGWSYFRKPAGIMSENEEIFCDDESRLDLLNRVFRGRMVPLLLLFFLVLIPNAGDMLRIEHPMETILAVVYMVTLMLYVVVFIRFAKFYYSFKRRMKM